MLVIAHRGYSGKFPENTLRAIDEALKLKAPAIEIDVHLSKDQQLVVTHDFALGRCVKGAANESNLSQYTAAELGNFDAGSFKGVEFSGERVPTLSKVLEKVSNTSLLNIEIKEETLVNETAYQTMAKSLLQALQNYGLKNILFSSFDPHMLRVLRSHSTEARIAMLDDRADRGPRIEEALHMKAEAYNINLKRTSLEIVKFIQAAGLKVYSYTAKNAADLELAKALQLDGVFADNLEEALKSFK